MPGGRPLKFASVLEMRPLIDKYFKETPEDEWTVTGLALALDTSRETLINYEERGEFFDALKQAKERVHNAYEKDGRKNGGAFNIFALKNFGWSDKQEHEMSGRVETVSSVQDEKVMKIVEEAEARIKAEILKTTKSE
jgi:hypothetical protein